MALMARPRAPGWLAMLEALFQGVIGQTDPAATKVRGSLRSEGGTGVRGGGGGLELEVEPVSHLESSLEQVTSYFCASGSRL